MSALFRAPVQVKHGSIGCFIFKTLLKVMFQREYSDMQLYPDFLDGEKRIDKVGFIY